MQKVTSVLLSLGKEKLRLHSCFAGGWGGVNEHGRCVPPRPPNRGKRRDAFVTICFLLSHQDSNLMELP